MVKEAVFGPEVTTKSVLHRVVASISTASLDSLTALVSLGWTRMHKLEDGGAAPS